MDDPTADTATTNPTGAFASFQAHDPRAMMRFLVDVLGFVENVAYTDDSGTIVHAQADWPRGGGVMFGSYKPDQPWHREPGTAGIYLVSDDVAAVHERAVAGAAQIIRGLESDDHGTGFDLRDPEGNLWSIGDYPGSPRVV